MVDCTHTQVTRNWTIMQLVHTLAQMHTYAYTHTHTSYVTDLLVVDLIGLLYDDRPKLANFL